MSYPDHIMVVHITANKPGSVSVQAKLSGPYADKITVASNKLIMEGNGNPGSKKTGLWPK
jgi:hypothetical protein